MLYYFLASALPELHVGAPPDITFNEFIHLLHDNMSKEDYEKIKVMRRFYDIQNAHALWKNEELDKWGNLDVNELDEALIAGVGFTEYAYVFDFLHRYEKDEDRLYHFSKLVVDYFKDEKEKAEGFLEEYLTFEKEWRLVFTAFRAKKMKRNIVKELQYEDPNDPLITQILAQKDATNYEPPERYRNLKTLFEEKSDHPFELYQALCEWRFEKIQEMIGLEMFTLDRILAYMAQLIIVDKWLELDKKKGLEIVDTIVEEIS